VDRALVKSIQAVDQKTGPSVKMEDEDGGMAKIATACEWIYEFCSRHGMEDAMQGELFCRTGGLLAGQMQSG
jgi:hypothetical protein